MFNVVLVNAHLTKMRPLKLFLEILPGIFFFFFRCCQSTASGISKLVGAVFVPISKQHNVRGPLTQLSARGIFLAAVRSPFYCRLRSRPLFLVLFPCCFLRFPRSPPSFFHAIFRLLSSSVPSPVRLDSAVTAILSSYTFYRPVSIYSFFLPRYRLCRLKISRAVVTAASRNRLKLIMTDSCEPKMETPRMMATRKSAMLAQCSEKKFCFMFTGSEAFQIANRILHVFDSRKKTEEKKI